MNEKNRPLRGKPKKKEKGDWFLSVTTVQMAFCCCKIGCNVSLLAVCVYLLLLNLKRSTSDV